MNDIGKLLNEIVEFIKELRAKIQKQDEILEILKETIKNNAFDVGMLDDRPNGKTWLSCEDFGITLKTEDYKKIKEWLDDGK